MALKRGLVVGAAGIGLLLLGGVALAASKKKPSGGGGGTTDDAHSAEACAAYRSERANMVANCNAIRGYIAEIDAARIQAASAGADTSDLDATRAGQVAALNACNARVNELDNLIAGCA